jgi:hypothetical protein
MVTAPVFLKQKEGCDLLLKQPMANGLWHMADDESDRFHRKAMVLCQAISH